MTAVSPISVARKLLGCDGTPEHEDAQRHMTSTSTSTNRGQRDTYGTRAYENIWFLVFGFGWFGNNETEITEIK